MRCMMIRPYDGIRCLTLGLGLLLTASTLQAECPTGPPTCHPDNPRYFADGDGNVLYLTGSHIWNNLQDWGTSNPPPALNFETYLDFLADEGHNFIRGWAWEHPRWIPWSTSDFHITPLPFERSCDGPMALDGRPRFDLTDFDDTYFSDIRERIQAAGLRDMYVGVMLFQGWSLKRPNRPGDPWRSHPFHHRNNCNQIDGDPPVPPAGERTGQGLRIHTMALPDVRAVQEAYIRRIIDELNDLDNIIWEISNESHHSGGGAFEGTAIEDLSGGGKGGFDFGSSVPWQHHLIDFIKSYEATQPKQHLVWMTGSTTFPKSDLDASNADVVSYGGQAYRSPPVADGSKISLLDTDHIWGLGGSRLWVWKTFTRGHNPIYMDPEFGIPLLPDPIEPPAAERDRIRTAMGKTREYAGRMDLASALPRPDLCSTGHCLANPGVEYLVYQPEHSDNGPNEFTVEVVPGTYTWEHYDAFLDRVRATGTETITSADTSWEFDLNARPIVFIQRVDGPPTSPPAPTGVAASDSTFADRIRVSWNVVSEATHYEVFRNFSNDPANATLLATTTATHFDHLEVYTPTVYYYWVRAVNGAGASGLSNGDTGTVAPAKIFFLDLDGDFVWDGPEIDGFIRYGEVGATAVAGDWNGNGTADLGAFFDGSWIVDMNGNGLIDPCGIDQCAQFGLAGDLPVVGDWNGDGRDQIGVFRNGNWTLDSNGNYAWDGHAIDDDFPYGLAGDHPTAGDWDGDGDDEIAVFRGGSWEVDRNGNHVFNGCGVDQCAVFGLAGDLAVAGDWNGDGRDSIGVFRNGHWSLDSNGNFSWDGPAIDADFDWGASDHDPVAGDWNNDGIDEVASARP